MYQKEPKRGLQNLFASFFFSFPNIIIPLSPYYLCLTCLTSTNHPTPTKKKGTAFKRSYAMQLITLLKPAAAQCGLPNEVHKTKHHAVPMVKVIFVCENDAARDMQVAMKCQTTLSHLGARAHALYANSVPQKLRGARVVITVNGYSLQGALTVGEIYETLKPHDGILHVFCKRIMTKGQKAAF